ncbi:hypothetical protein SELMODRAFT_413024 [Selaginella moellendorffii]|uniref:Uncharacterized protein n=1 Tax=Selaginella moellendorffii TaxID=88036 RepID=D8RN38_SELML|nr:hypothetical protein SELMODRAFT_413024 [Selaginella moellendorffii]
MGELGVSPVSTFWRERASLCLGTALTGCGYAAVEWNLKLYGFAVAWITSSSSRERIASAGIAGRGKQNPPWHCKRWWKGSSPAASRSAQSWRLVGATAIIRVIHESVELGEFSVLGWIDSGAWEIGSVEDARKNLEGIEEKFWNAAIAACGQAGDSKKILCKLWKEFLRTGKLSSRPFAPSEAG